MSEGWAKRPSVVFSTKDSTTPGTIQKPEVAPVSTRPWSDGVDTDVAITELHGGDGCDMITAALAEQ